MKPDLITKTHMLRCRPSPLLVRSPRRRCRPSLADLRGPASAASDSDAEEDSLVRGQR
ncbi:MAG: hypothetical protein MZV70_28905 [Desulfobacterales bacterium]|nr:hypothetical protein [Desulfobacterales bacterium]